MKHPLLGLALIGLAACNPPPVTSGDDTTDAVVSPVVEELGETADTRRS